MILLRRDCLEFKNNNGTGEAVPCSAQQMTVELMGDAAASVDEELVKNAAEAVLHYFKHELGRTTVTTAEFSQALEQVLRGLGFDVQSNAKVSGNAPAPRVIDSDLRLLACQSGKGFELIFFNKLREELRLKLTQSPNVLRFNGLRGCVKQLVGAKRWGMRCQRLNDQIVDYLRTCLSAEYAGRSCALVVF
jgi:hypothetical protein